MPATKSKRRKPSREQLKPEECLCDFCTGICCRYFSLPIINPTTWDEFDAIRWYLAHGQTVIYVEDKQWYLLVKTRCNYLTADNRCGIYFNRPKVCREYTTDGCEYDGGWSFEKVFETPEQIWEYARGRAAAAARPASTGRHPADRVHQWRQLRRRLNVIGWLMAGWWVLAAARRLGHSPLEIAMQRIDGRGGSRRMGYPETARRRTGDRTC